MLLVDTFVGPSVIEGVGVFAAEPIKAGQVIYRFDPYFDRLISRAELASFPASIRRFVDRYTYPHPTDRLMLVLDVDNGRHMNHSREPNTDFRDATFGYAIRDIASGEEITCNYADFEPEFEMLPSLVNAFTRQAFVEVEQRLHWPATGDQVASIRPEGFGRVVSAGPEDQMTQ
ncbi:MAG: SET domain-containing protein-lysine N-methyltransferase [Planctomycetia bacterium]|jgi:SET domain-containing protein|nr:SET domain-containing protein-lysine N-methyltransferase [Planctomycetia bacterium]